LNDVDPSWTGITSPNSEQNAAQLIPRQSSRWTLAVTRHSIPVTTNILADSFTRAYVLKHANVFESEFFQDFAESMIKMGNIGVITSSHVKIRKKCHIIN
jgi:hypothetical protein